MKKSIKALFTISAMAAGVLLNSCDSSIFDYEGDCSVHYRLPITFKMNYLNADALASQVNSVTLYIFDRKGDLVMQKTESGEALTVPDYTIDVDLQPGRYSMLVWGTGEAQSSDPNAFVVGSDDRLSLSDFSATLPLSGSGDNLYSDRDITPLFHGYAGNVELPNTYGTVDLPAIDLTKDTNLFSIALENVDGAPIEPDALTVRIEADNSELDWQNLPFGNRFFSYTPWSIEPLGTQRPASRDGDIEGQAEDNVTGLLVELTTGRLMADKKTMLVVHRTKDDTDVLRLDLVNLLCLVRGHYGSWTAQEYLDRIDRFTLTFFIDANLGWYTAGGINILGWHIVPPQDMDL